MKNTHSLFLRFSLQNLFIKALCLFLLLTTTNCSEINDIKQDIDSIYAEITDLKSAIESLNDAYSDGKIIKSVEATSDSPSGGWLITFSDDSKIKLPNGLTPLIKIDENLNWIVSYDGGATFSQIIDKDGNSLVSKGEKGDEGISVRVVINDDGFFVIETYYSTNSTTIISSITTPYTSNKESIIQSIVEKEGIITITMMNGTVFTFNKDIKYPLSIVTLSNSICISDSDTTSIEFRVNPSNAKMAINDIHLDLISATTKGETTSYITIPDNYKLAKIQQSIDENGKIKEGQYSAYIVDLNKKDSYDETIALVVSTKNNDNENILISSDLIAIKKQFNIPAFVSFSFKEQDNPLYLSKDIELSIEDGKISSRIPYYSSIKSIKATFVTNIEDADVYVGNVKQESGETINDFRKDVKYVVKDKKGHSQEYVISVVLFTGLPVITVHTENNAPIVSKDDYVNAQITVDGIGQYNDLEETAKIKGRGNSTWGLPKKPYKIKFNSKQSLLGEAKDKEWVLLANYTDKTFLRNATAFYMGEISNLEWTPCTHFVELFINEQYMGTYHLSEQIKISDKRVNVSDDGYLLEVDQLSRLDPGDVYFQTSRLLFNIKDPDVELNSEKYNWIKNYVINAENSLYGEAYLDEFTGYKTYLNIESFVDWSLINEIAKNNDACLFSSCYMNIAPNGKLNMGPLWDFDISLGNIDYSGNEDYTGFWIYTSPWFSRMMLDPDFVMILKERFNYFYANKNMILSFVNSNSIELQESVIENNNKWGTFYNYTWPNYAIWGSYQNEVQYLKNWLNNRFEWLKGAIDAL